MLDVDCGDGRLASLLNGHVAWTGVDSSRNPLAKNPHRTVVLADMRMLPFRDSAFAEVTQLGDGAVASWARPKISAHQSFIRIVR